MEEGPGETGIVKVSFKVVFDTAEQLKRSSHLDTARTALENSPQRSEYDELFWTSFGLIFIQDFKMSIHLLTKSAKQKPELRATQLFTSS